MQGITIARPCPRPLVALGAPLRDHVPNFPKHAPTCCFSLKTTFSSIKKKACPLHVSAMSTPLSPDPRLSNFFHNLQHNGKKHSHTHRPRASKSKDNPFDLQPYPQMTEKPKWWWRTLSCLPYLMTFYEHQYWVHAHPATNPPAFLENFDSFTFPLVSAIVALPRLFLSAYAIFSYFGIVRRREWPHFLRLHVMTAVLLGCIVQVIGISSGWFPSKFFPPHFWSAATFAFLITVLECMRCALTGKYADVPFVDDAAYLHTDLNLR